MKLAAFLKREGVEAAAYHGGMSTSERDETQRAWVDNTHRVIVATNAFGMGIDKPDVRFVLHHNAPFDLESYYQEAGRGGRDGKTALAIAFFNPPDLAEAQRWIALRYPSWKLLSDTYEMLHSHHNIPHTGAVFSQQAFDIQAISKKLEQPLMAVYQAVKLLDTEGLIQLEEESDDYGWLRIKASPNEVLRYRKNHKQVGLVLEHALRKLGGEAYHYEQRFLPGRWAELLTMPVAEVQQHLKTLVKAGMVYYQVPRNHPRITFFQPRQRFSKDLLDWNKYIFLEQRAKARFKALKAYLGKESNCRSLYIQQYFGESSKKTCGVCDLCIARKKKLRTSQSLNDLQSHILAQVKAHPGISYRDLIHQINFGTEAQREAGLRLLIDENLISASEMGLLYSKE
jgi:ATP-dependent DNA helicase RecQ